MNDKIVLKKIFYIFKRYYKNIFFVMLGLLLTVIINIYIPLLNKEIMNIGFLELNFGVIIKYSLYIFIIKQISFVILYIIEICRIKIVTNIKMKLEELTFQHLIKIKYDFYDNISKFDLLNQIDIDLNSICGLFNNNILNIIVSIFTIIGGMVGIIIIDVKLACLLLIMLPIKYTIVYIHSKKQRENRKVVLITSSNFAKWISDIVAGIKEVRLFNIISQVSAKHNRLTRDKINAQNNIEILTRLRQIADDETGSILDLLTYIIAGYLVVKNELSVGDVFAFISYSSYVLLPLSSILNIKLIIHNILPSATRFFEFIDIEEEENHGNMVKEVLKIEFDGVNFNYNMCDNVLSNFNLTIPMNSKIAIIGDNGSGKSSVLELLLRLYETDRGIIRLNNTNIRELNLVNYRELFSYVGQNFYLFNDTIKNNITLNTNLSVSDEIMEEIIRDIGIDDLVREKGEDFVIGIDGAYLSGGQRQKIALARAFAYNRPIFILDEATSNTDTNFDENFGLLVKKYLKDKTVILVTHDMKILELVDYVIYMEKGQITNIEDKYNIG